MMAACALMAVALASASDAAPPSKAPRATLERCYPSLLATGPGLLDQSFGCRGVRVTTAPGSTSAAPIHYAATDLAIQTDNRIVVVGRRMQQIGNNNDTLVLRFTAGGDLDATFGTAGAVVVNASGSGFGFESARAVLLQSDGAIVVVGTSSDETVEGTKGYILRLTPAGALDAAFGVGGITQIAATKEATDLTGDGAGGFYVSGRNCQPTCTAQLAHVLADGALDPAFGVGGVLAIAFAGGAETAEAVTRTDARLAVAGLSGYALGQGDLGASRFAIDAAASASLDPTFSSDGKLTKALGGQGSVGDLLLNADLGMTVGGSAADAGGARRFALTRITPAGVATTTTAVFPSTSEGAINALSRTSTRTYGAGYVRMSGGGYRMALAAYTPGGALDATFSGDGMASYGLSGEVRATGVGVQSGGRIVMVGGRTQTSTAPGAIVLAGITP
jgi:uncharacterized delta-60 repeat protein